jgi:16S rRNA (cytidine1402-2'-O)-methyltransferase
MEGLVSILYVVATPIGNLEDITDRAKRILSEVDLIAAEDTRHTSRLLAHLNITTPVTTYHDHSESTAGLKLVAQLKKGVSIALVSDAGTPLIADPGYRLVNHALEEGIEVVPVPGPSAFVAAMSVAGLPSDKFTFYGFLPAKAKAREDFLANIVNETGTLVFYESPHRIVKTMAALEQVFGQERLMVVARELTKTFEQVVRKPIGEIRKQIDMGEIVIKGEFVLLLQGQQHIESKLEERKLLELLMAELPLSKAAEITSRLTGQGKNDLYKMALDIKRDILE